MAGRRVSDAVNQLTVSMVVRADSPEAAARLFGGHPHMSIFVCDGVEVMPVLGTEPPAPPSVVGGRLRREAPAGSHRGEFP